MPEGEGSNERIAVVGIGASAGGIQACKDLLAAMPVGQGLAVVVVLHLSPDHPSQLVGLFQAVTSLTVVEATDGAQLLPDQVHVLPPDATLRFRGDVCWVEAGVPTEVRGRLIDRMLESLAETHGARAIAVILSGTGSDGTEGAARVRARGGAVVAQEPNEAEHPDMPRSVIRRGLADEVLPCARIPEALVSLAEGKNAPVEDDEVATVSHEDLAPVLDIVGRRYGIDFRNYKVGTLQRRIERRMLMLHLDDWASYADRLRETPAEVAALLDDLLIGVTRFFRDPQVWEALAANILPELVAQRRPGRRMRAWVAGCATGEEAYTVAMLLREALETARAPGELQVFATDIDDDALQFARAGSYPRAIAADVSPARLQRFFEQKGERWVVGRSLRELVTFARHDLLSDPPFSDLDFLSCRNLLIYLRGPVQRRTTELFHFALRPGGCLLLGTAESTGRARDLFERVDNQANLYRRLVTPGVRGAAVSAGGWSVGPTGTAPRRAHLGRLVERVVLDRYTAPCVVVNRQLEVVYLFGRVVRFLQQPSGDARLDLLAWTPGGLYTPVRNAVQRALEAAESTELAPVLVEVEGKPRRIQCTVEPLPVAGEEGLVAVTFRELSGPQASAGDGSPGAEVRELEDALGRTQAELRQAVDELKAVEEDHRGAHEEMLSLNEELQSTNEELETSKEELQSMNEELDTLNRQLQSTNEELTALNRDLSNLLDSTDLPSLFVDEQLRLHLVTPAAERIAHVTPDDRGRALEGVKFRVDDARLLDDVRHVRDGLGPVEREVEDTQGRIFTRITRPYLGEGGTTSGVCISFHEITALRRAASDLDDALGFAEAIVRTVPTAILVLDEALRVRRANDPFFRMFDLPKEEVEGHRIYEIGGGEWDLPYLRSLLEGVLPKRQSVVDYEVEHTFAKLGARVLRFGAQEMTRAGHAPMMLLAIEDLTQQRANERAIAHHAEELARADRQKDEFLALLGHELRNPLAAIAQGVHLLGREGGAGRLSRVQPMLYRQTARITSMIDQLLDVSRITSGKLVLKQRPVDLVDAAHAALESLGPVLERDRRELMVRLPERGALVVSGDLIRLGQVIENLLGNAVKYSRTGDRITLELEAAPGDLALIRVRDQGIGISKELLPTVFDAFVQEPRAADRAGGGLGLGLRLVRGIVELLGGEVRAESAGPGKGSEFVVSLPRLHEVSGRTDDHFEPHVGQSVLVVDDERDVADGLAALLNDSGHRARAVYDGDAALAAIRERVPDLILLDLGLPSYDGYELAHRVRTEWPTAPITIVALSGYARDDEKLARAAVDGHVLKPASPAALAPWLSAAIPGPVVA